MEGIKAIYIGRIRSRVHGVDSYPTDLHIDEPGDFVEYKLLKVVYAGTGCGTYSNKKYHVVIIQSTTHEEVIYLGEQVEGVALPSLGHCGFPVYSTR